MNIASIRQIAVAAAVILSAGQAFAEYQCTREHSPGVTSTALIKRWPNLQIERTSPRCETSEDGIEKCVAQTDILASPFEVCGVLIDTTHSCQTTETTSNGGHILDIDCNSGIRINFNMNKKDEGRLTCYQGNMVYSMWDVGTCKVVN